MRNEHQEILWNVPQMQAHLSQYQLRAQLSLHLSVKDLFAQQALMNSHDFSEEFGGSVSQCVFPLSMPPFTCLLSLVDKTLSSCPSLFLRTCIATPIRDLTRHMPLVVREYVETICFLYYIVRCSC